MLLLTSIWVIGAITASTNWSPRLRTATEEYESSKTKFQTYTIPYIDEQVQENIACSTDELRLPLNPRKIKFLLPEDHDDNRVNCASGVLHGLRSILRHSSICNASVTNESKIRTDQSPKLDIIENPSNLTTSKSLPNLMKDSTPELSPHEKTSQTENSCRYNRRLKVLESKFRIKNLDESSESAKSSNSDLSTFTSNSSSFTVESSPSSIKSILRNVGPNSVTRLKSWSVPLYSEDIDGRIVNEKDIFNRIIQSSLENGRTNLLRIIFAGNGSKRLVILPKSLAVAAKQKHWGTLISLRKMFQNKRVGFGSLSKDMNLDDEHLSAHLMRVLSTEKWPQMHSSVGANGMILVDAVEMGTVVLILLIWSEEMSQENIKLAIGDSIKILCSGRKIVNIMTILRRAYEIIPQPMDAIHEAILRVAECGDCDILREILSKSDWTLIDGKKLGVAIDSAVKYGHERVVKILFDGARSNFVTLNARSLGLTLLNALSRENLGALEALLSGCRQSSIEIEPLLIRLSVRAAVRCQNFDKILILIPIVFENEISLRLADLDYIARQAFQHRSESLLFKVLGTMEIRNAECKKNSLAMLFRGLKLDYLLRLRIMAHISSSTIYLETLEQIISLRLPNRI